MTKKIFAALRVVVGRAAWRGSCGQASVIVLTRGYIAVGGEPCSHSLTTARVTVVRVRRAGRDRAGRVGGSPDAGMLAACDDLLVRPTVVIVDDDAGFRSLARALLEAEGFDVVGEADDGAAALAVVDLLHPRVVLLDIQLPGIDGFEVAERLAGAGDPPVVVLVSARGVSSYRRRLAGSPARGFISKSELSGHALAALVS